LSSKRYFQNLGHQKIIKIILIKIIIRENKSRKQENKKTGKQENKKQKKKP